MRPLVHCQTAVEVRTDAYSAESARTIMELFGAHCL
jgi:hypothetical protein